MYFGNYVAFDKVPTKEEIDEAREKIVERLCDEIRCLSKEYPEEFFIVKDVSQFPIDKIVMTIGAKLDAPTIQNKEYI